MKKCPTCGGFLGASGPIATSLADYQSGWDAAVASYGPEMKAHAAELEKLRAQVGVFVYEHEHARTGVQSLLERLRTILKGEGK
jgi:hypothetical protein